MKHEFLFQKVNSYSEETDYTTDVGDHLFSADKERVELAIRSFKIQYRKEVKTWRIRAAFYISRNGGVNSYLELTITALN